MKKITWQEFFSQIMVLCEIYNELFEWRNIDSPNLPVGYDISPLKRVKLKLLTTSRQASG